MKIKLLKFEKDVGMRLSNISMIYFFDGDSPDLFGELRERMIKLLELNPWMASTFIRENKDIRLKFDENKTAEEMVDKLLFNDTKLCVDESMEYAQMYKALDKYVVLNGKKLIKSGGYITKLTLLSHRLHNAPGAAILFSMSHVAVDGYTYFKLANSIFDPSQMLAMNYQRNLKVDNAIWDVLRKSETKFLFSIRLLMKIFRNVYLGRKAQYFSRFLDEDKMDAVKESYAQNPKHAFPFISTNDIITSAFCNATNSRLSLLLINLRNRIEGIGDADAGNYQFVLPLDKAHYGSPEDIRKVLTNKEGFECSDGNMPGLFETLNSNITMLTNIASFNHDFQICGLKQVLFIPVRSPQRTICDTAIIYKAKDNRRALFFLGRATTPADFLKNCELGETVSESLFK